MLTSFSRWISPWITGRFGWSIQLLGSRIGRPDLNPLPDVLDLLLGESAARRHGKLLILITDRLKQGTPLGITRNDGDPRLAARAGTRGMRDIKVALERSRVLTMTLKTVVEEDRTNLAFKELNTDRIDLGLE